MKKLFKISFTCLLLLTAIQVMAQDDNDKKEKKKYEFSKERSISKSYPASGNNLNISNSFGSVKITTWDKNEIKVDIHIEASSNQKEMADKTFESLDVKDSQEGKNINFKTITGNVRIECHNCSNTMSVDYDIHIPASNKLMIENSFGSVTLPDYNGDLTVKSSYGSLTAGKLTHADAVIVEFGKATIKDITSSELTFRYSEATVESLGGNSKMKMEFCSYSRIGLANDLTSFAVMESYSTLHLQPASNLSATYDVTTSYGSFLDKANIGIKRTDKPDQYGPDLNQRYEGKSGSGTGKIDIRSSFGTIVIGGTEAEVKASNGNKQKNKNKRVV